jgi:hypothetical protein
VAVTVCTLATARAQSPYDRDLGPKPVPREAVAAPTNFHQSAGLSDWILYRRHDCCDGPLGGDPPFGNELYLRVGPCFPLSGRMGDVLETGWAIQGGARALCYNPSETAAWVVDASLSNYNNDGNRPDVRFPITFGDGSSQQVSVTGFNRTFVTLGGGHEWYLGGRSKDEGNTWRVGLDGGGRYGTAKADFREIRHRTDVIGGVYVAGYADFELPISSCCVFFGGVRTEWSYTWSDILQRQSDVQDLNVLFTLGVNY